jgi:hypothetical protein
MTRVRRRDYSKLTRNIKRIPTCFLHVCSNDPLESLQQRNKPGAFRRRTTTSRSRVGPRERLDPLCKQGKPYPSATSACRSSAEALILTLADRRALGTRSTPDSSCSWWHCGRRWCTLAQLKAIVGAADHCRKLARASKRVPLGPHVTTPAGMAYAPRWGAARPLSQRREILHQADIAGRFGMERWSDRVSLRWSYMRDATKCQGW